MDKIVVDRITDSVKLVRGYWDKDGTTYVTMGMEVDLEKCVDAYEWHDFPSEATVYLSIEDVENFIKVFEKCLKEHFSKGGNDDEQV